MRHCALRKLPFIRSSVALFLHGGQARHRWSTCMINSKASHSNNVCWIVSDSRDSQQGHCALRTSCIRQLELRRSWQPNRNFVFNLRPSRRDAGHALSKYSGKPKRSFSTQLFILRRVDILLKPSTSSETLRDATNS